MDANNVVVVRGTVSSEPLVRTLPSGDVVTQVELKTLTAEGAVSVPIAVHGKPVVVGAGDEVVVTGHVSRRFFRAGGATQARTEVIAHRVIKARRHKTVERAVGQVIELLAQNEPVG